MNTQNYQTQLFMKKLSRRFKPLVLFLMLGANLSPCYSQNNTKAMSPVEFYISHWEFRPLGSKKWIKDFQFEKNYFKEYYARFVKEPLPKNYFDAEKKAMGYFNSLSWEFRYRFNYSDYLQHHPHVVLILNRVNTFCEIHINEKKIKFLKNAFIEYKIDLKNHLKKGINEIKLVFHPSHLYAKENLLDKTFNFPADNQSGELKTAPYIRQKQSDFGWDFIRPSHFFGLKSSAQLLFWNTIRIDQLKSKQLSLSKTKARVELSYSIYSGISDSIDVNYFVNDEYATYALEVNKKIKVKVGENIFQDTIEINAPRKWYPRGTFLADSSSLYQFSLIINSPQHNWAHTKTTHFGLRTVELIQEKDEYGQSFYFRINGYPIYAKGYNITDRIDESVFIGTNFNCLRVWGGGEYLSDEFYTLADQYGVMIWQDFMFSGSYYPADSGFLKSVDEELKYQIKRIAQHPSLVLWCGNNEIDVAAKNWGWEKKYNYSIQQQAQFKKNYEKLFQQFIPARIAELDPSIPYIHTSPLSNWGKEEDFNSGDNHYWGVWHGEEAIDSFATKIPRFASEFGFPSLPNRAEYAFGGTEIGMNLPDILSRLVLSYKGYPLLEKYIRANYKNPNSLQDWIYLSQLTQAKALKIAIQAQRLSQKCKGSLVWQLNGGEYVADWSILDFHEGPKMAFYTCEKNFEPVLPVLKMENNSMYLTLINNYTDELNSCQFSYQIVDQNGKVYLDESKTIMFYMNYRQINNQGESFVKLYPHHVQLAFNLNNVLEKNGKNNLILKYQLTLPNNKKTEDYCLFVNEKDFNYKKAKISYTLNENKNGILISTDVFTEHIQVSYSDRTDLFNEQYFTLFPSNKKELKFRPEIAEIVMTNNIFDTSKIKFICLNNIIKK